jgi:hypothetical protein
VSRALRTIVKNPFQLFILLLLPIAIGSMIAYLQPRQYQASATLWALHRYDTLTATSVDSTSLDTPAETQATVLTALVQTRAFSLEVAKEAKLASTLPAQVQADPQNRDDALVNDISHNTVVQATTNDFFVITYTNADPQITQKVVAAIIDFYGQQIQHTSATDEKVLLATYQTQLAQAQQQNQNAVAAESHFQQTHPLLTGNALQQEPQYQYLYGQTLQAQQNLQNIQTSIITLQQDITTHAIIASNLYQVVDAPAVPNQPLSRVKTLLLGIGAGLVIALVACTLFIILTMRRDRRVYSSSDLQKVTTYPVVMELPRLSPKTVSVLAKTSIHSES